MSFSLMNPGDLILTESTRRIYVIGIAIYIPAEFLEKNAMHAAQ